MGRKPLSAYTKEELEQLVSKRMLAKVDEILDDEYEHYDYEHVLDLIQEIEGTAPFFYLLSKLVVQKNALTAKVIESEKRIENLEAVLSKVGKSFNDKDEYGGHF